MPRQAPRLVDMERGYQLVRATGKTLHYRKHIRIETSNNSLASLTCKKESVTHVFREDLVYCLRQGFPVEHLDVLLNIARLRSGKIHDLREEILRA